MMQKLSTEAVICGAGSAGLAAAYYLSQLGLSNIILIDKHDPLSQTSSKSGENYRTWWPNETMVGFMSRSIDLMDDIAAATQNEIGVDRKGYLYISENASLDFLDNYKDLDVGESRIHEGSSNYQYTEADLALDGSDILIGNRLIKEHFPHLSDKIELAVHARKAGSLSAQQLGMYHLSQAKAKGLQHIQAELTAVHSANNSITGVSINSTDGEVDIDCNIFINAAGPFINKIAALFDENLPIKNVFQQKIAFRDYEAVLPRKMPFTIYLDQQKLEWSQEDHDLLSTEPDYAWFFDNFQGGLHIKPEGGDGSILVKLGWAFNQSDEAEPQWDKRCLEEFPELVSRGASRFIPEMKRYIGKLPKPILHYGGYYTKTEENMPLIGPMNTKGAYVVGALSGFGTMACCAAGELVALQALQKELPSYAKALAPSRYDDIDFLEHLRLTANNGEL